MQEATVLAQLAGSRPIVPLAHARQRTDGVIAVEWRDGALVTLCAHRCALDEVPDAIAAFTALERLDVGGNQLTALPALPAGLRELYVDDNQLARLPALPALAVLDANRNHLVEVPALTGLGFAYLADNRLTALPATAGVRYLNVSGNPLGHIAPDDPALRELRAEQAQLASLDLRRVTGLRELALRGNALVRLPASIGALTELRTLDLRGNQLDELPESLRALPLTKLDLRWNPLRDRPAWLRELADRGCLVYT
jgi:Leucine-rich repeat (LRR) protein